MNITFIGYNLYHLLVDIARTLVIHIIFWILETFALLLVHSYVLMYILLLLLLNKPYQFCLSIFKNICEDFPRKQSSHLCCNKRIR